MSKPITLAAIQMDASPAPTAARQQHAERLVRQAVSERTQLVHFPETFDSGYAYSDENDRLDEPVDSTTATLLQVFCPRASNHQPSVDRTLTRRSP